MKDGYADCMNNTNGTTSACKRAWNPKRDTSANCTLPSIVADRIEFRLDKAKNFCASYG